MEFSYDKGEKNEGEGRRSPLKTPDSPKKDSSNKEKIRITHPRKNKTKKITEKKQDLKKNNQQSSHMPRVQQL